MNDYADCKLGQTSGLIRLETSAEHRAVACALTLQCRRFLDIAARQLDPAVYDTAEFAEAVKALALRSRFSRIRLLVLQPQGLITRGHRLIGLASQLSSFISIRRPGEEHKDFNESMLIADRTGLIHRSLGDRYVGIASFHDPARAVALQQRFDELWDNSELDPNFRRLHI